MTEQSRHSRYRELREELPELFVNPPGAPFEILDDPSAVVAVEDAMAARLAAQGRPPCWGHTGVVFEDPYTITLRDPVRLPDDTTGTYSRRINAGNAAGVVIMPVHSGDVVLVRHFRHSTRRWHLELPRGFGTPGQSADDDARRELLEEIGAVPTDLISLGSIYPDTGQMSTPVHLYYAEIERFDVAGQDEGIESTRVLSPPELAELIRTGEIDDGFTISAYTHAALRGLVPFPAVPAVPASPESPASPA